MFIVDIACSPLRECFQNAVQGTFQRCQNSMPRTGRNGQSVQPHVDPVDDANAYGPEAQLSESELQTGSWIEADEKTSDNSDN